MKKTSLRLRATLGALALFAANANAMAATPPAQAAHTAAIPHLAHKDGRYTLMVDGKPFTILGVQAHNSSNYPQALGEVWSAVKDAHGNAAAYARYVYQILGRGAIGVAPFGIDYADYSNYPLGSKLKDKTMVEPFGKIYAVFRPLAPLWATWAFEGRTRGIAEGDERTPQTMVLKDWNITVSFRQWQFGDLPATASAKDFPPNTESPNGGVAVAQVGDKEFVVIGQNARLRIDGAGVNAGGKACEIVLVESPEIGTVGVGEATLPSIRYFNLALGLDGADFVRKTQATFKLGIEFKDWGHIGNRFFHGFGDFGPAIENRPPTMYWLRLAREFKDMPSYEEWSVATAMARSHRFTPPYGDTPAPTNAYSYAFHFDAGLYAAYLRDYAMQRGVERIEGMITEVEQHPETGFITAVKLRDGRRVEGDLFIDCSGFRGLLNEGVYKAGYDDWSAMLPSNSALAVPCTKVDDLTPYTTSTAKPAGWTWRIPLQHRTGNGHVYCNGFTTDEAASRILLDGLDGSALGEPRQLRFTTGRRRKSWIKNCVAVGLSSGFLEPLESTSINIIENAVGWLLQYFPNRDFRPELADEFNRLVSERFEFVRDFIILHYKVTNRTDSEFWRYCANMPIPDTLQHQIELFRETGRVVIYDPQGFSVPSHVSILMGLGVVPKAYDPLIDLMDLGQLHAHFARLRASIGHAVKAMPGHTDYIARHVAADPAPATP